MTYERRKNGIGTMSNFLLTRQRVYALMDNKIRPKDALLGRIETHSGFATAPLKHTTELSNWPFFAAK